MRGGDHDAAVEFIRPRYVGNAGRGGHVQHIRIGTRCRQARRDGILQHIARPARVLADQDAGTVVGHMEAGKRRGVVPAEKTPYPIGVVGGQSHVGFPPEAVRAEVFVLGARFVDGGFLPRDIAEQRNVIPQKSVRRDTEQAAQCQDVFDLRKRLIDLPLGNRLAGNGKLLCQLFL